MRTEFVVVTCVDASGMPTAPVYEVKVTEEEYDLGVHYDKAEELAMEDRYEKPFLCFDNSEHQELFNTVAFLRLKRKTGQIE